MLEEVEVEIQVQEECSMQQKYKTSYKMTKIDKFT